jgi:hypothetical protein
MEDRVRVRLAVAVVLLVGCGTAADLPDGGGAVLDAGVDTTMDGGAPAPDGGPDGEDASIDAGDPGDAGDAVDAGDPAEDAMTGNPFACLVGDMSRTDGEVCGCAEDCSNTLCARRLTDPLGFGYCTGACGEGNACPSGFSCVEELELIGLEPFCAQCTSPTGGDVPVGGACTCVEDCVEGATCAEGTCAAECFPIVDPCEGNAQCVLEGTTFLCVDCLEETPRTVPVGGDCGCPNDCVSGLSCEDGTCLRPCEEDADCDEGEECRLRVGAASFCRPTDPEVCDDTLAAPIGGLCNCNAECGAEAPDCVTIELPGLPDTGLCTVRPCDRGAATPCPTDALGNAWRCCEQLFVLPATCVPPGVAAAIEGAVTCSE